MNLSPPSFPRWTPVFWAASGCLTPPLSCAAWRHTRFLWCSQRLRAPRTTWSWPASSGRQTATSSWWLTMAKSIVSWSNVVSELSLQNKIVLLCLIGRLLESWPIDVVTLQWCVLVLHIFTIVIPFSLVAAAGYQHPTDNVVKPRDLQSEEKVVLTPNQGEC